MHRARRTVVSKYRAVASVTLVAASTLSLVACDRDDGREMREPTTTSPPVDNQTNSFSEVDQAPLTVPVEPTTPMTDLALVAPWQNGDEIPVVYTCDGDDVSPALQWSTGPNDTIEYAITIVDPDANNYVHWIVSGIDPAVTSLSENELPPGVIVSANSAGDEAYTGPCPPVGATHNYVVTVFALSQQLELSGAETPSDLVALFQLTALTSSSLSGTYARGGTSASDDDATE